MMDVAKILSVVFEGDTGDKGDLSSKALERRDNSSHSPVLHVSPDEVPWGTNSEPKGDSESNTDQHLAEVCPPVPPVPRNFVDRDTYEERSAIIHEAHTRTIADDGTPLPAPIFEITREQAETLAAQDQGHADADSLHGEMVGRWAAEIERLAKRRAASPEGAEALKRAQMFISDGWVLQAARLGWNEVELFGVCPVAPWQRLDRKGAAFGGAVQAVTQAAVVYAGGMHRYRATVNNDGGAVPIWELAPNNPSNGGFAA